MFGTGFEFWKENKDDYEGSDYKRLKLMDSTDQTEANSPLGLKLRKTPSFLDLFQMKLNEVVKASQIECTKKRSITASQIECTQRRNIKSDKTRVRHEECVTQLGTERMKASNFSALYLKIGSWERVCRYDGDLVAKCYFAKRKIVWEVLYSGLKNKIEIPWSDISAIKATICKNEPGILEIEVNHTPLFYHEKNPQPRKHTLWQATSDFTGGQASIYRRHHIQFPEGTLDKHYEKLLQFDNRLYELSQKPFPILSSPYFNLSHDRLWDNFYDINMKIPGSTLGFDRPDNSPLQFPHTGIARSILVLTGQVPNLELLRPTIGANNLISQCSVIDFPPTEKIGVKEQVGHQRVSFWDEIGAQVIGNRDQIQDSTSIPLSNQSNWSEYPQHLPSNLLSSNWLEQYSLDDLNMIAEQLLNEPSTNIYSDDHEILAEVNSMHSLLAPSQMNLALESTGMSHEEYGPLESIAMKHEEYWPLESIGMKHEEYGLKTSSHDLMISRSPELIYYEGGYSCPNLANGLHVQPSTEIPLNNLPRITSLPYYFLDQRAGDFVNDHNTSWNQWSLHNNLSISFFSLMFIILFPVIRIIATL